MEKAFVRFFRSFLIRSPAILQVEIHAEHDRKLEAARQQRQSRRQQAA
jgi:hypothetical protein